MGLLIPTTIGLAIVYTIGKAVYDIFFSPLAGVPGPFFCKISYLPSWYHACVGDRHIWLWQLFQIYGHRIRAAPNMVLFDSPAAYHSIYNPKANIKKADFYLTYQRTANDDNTLTITDPKYHAERKGNLKMAFTDRSLKASGPFMAQQIDRWDELILHQADAVEKPDPEGWSPPRDMAQWAAWLIFDILTDICFGKSCDTKEPESPYRNMPRYMNQYMEFTYPLARTSSSVLKSILWLKPRGMNDLLMALAPKEVIQYYTFVREQVDRRIAEMREREAAKLPPEREDMYHFLATARIPDTGELACPPEILHKEANLLIVAGADTSAVTLGGLFFYLTRYPRAYAKLVKEIRSTFASAEDIFHGPALSGCEYLRACIMETLRLTPPVPSEFSREVLEGGIKIDGDFYPAGTLTGTPNWALGRNEEMFDDAHTYRPERWIVSNDVDTLNTKEDVSKLKHDLRPFLTGPGMCPGQHVAWLQMTLTVARTLWRMDARLAPGTSVGAGKEKNGWGQKHPNTYLLHDSFLAGRKGPMVQFKARSF